MLIASTLSDSGWFWKFSGVRLKVFIQDLRGIRHLIVQAHAAVGTIRQYPRIWMLITLTTKQMTHNLVPLSVVFDSSSALLLVKFTACSSSVHHNTLDTVTKGCCGLFLNVSFSVVSKTNYLDEQIPGEQENTCSSLFSVLFIWRLQKGFCMWMSAQSAVTFRLSHCN